jgi:hypothetical protein
LEDVPLAVALLVIGGIEARFDAVSSNRMTAVRFAVSVTVDLPKDSFPNWPSSVEWE